MKRRRIRAGHVDRLAICAAIALILFSVPAVAQGVANQTDTIDGLHRASGLMESAQNFFIRMAAVAREPTSPVYKNYVTPTDSEIDNNYGKMQAATGLFLRFATQRHVADAIEKVGGSFASLGLAKPATVQDAVAQCDKLRSPALSSRVSGALATVLRNAWQGEAAEARYGPIVDNPSLYAAIHPPVGAIDLLHNIKWAIEHDALLREDFFTADNMNRFFGRAALPVRWTDRVWARWAVRPSEAELAAMPSNLASIADCIYLVSRSEHEKRGLEGEISISCSYNNRGYPTFDDVREVFGEKWQPGWMVFGPPRHGPPPRATARHGNEQMVYRFDDAHLPSGKKYRRGLVVRFRPDASLARLDFSEREF